MDRKAQRAPRPPQQLDTDRDLSIPLLAFEEQAFNKRGISRFVTKYQAFSLSFPRAVSMLRGSIGFILPRKTRRPGTEALAIILRFVLYFGLLFTVLEPLTAVLYIPLMDHSSSTPKESPD